MINRTQKQQVNFGVNKLITNLLRARGKGGKAEKILSFLQKGNAKLDAGIAKGKGYSNQGIDWVKANPWKAGLGGAGIAGAGIGGGVGVASLLGGKDPSTGEQIINQLKGGAGAAVDWQKANPLQAGGIQSVPQALLAYKLLSSK